MNKEINYKKLENIRHSSELDGLLVVAIIECIRKAFGEAPGDTAEHLNGDEIILAIEGEKVILYFSAFHEVSPREHLHNQDLSEVKGTYLSAVAVDGDSQGKGISKAVYEQALTPRLRERVPLIFLRTQNPRIEAGINSFLDQAKQKGDISGFRLERRLLEKVYGQMLTTTPPRSSNAEIQSHYDAIDRKAGDAYLLIFHLQYGEER